MKEKLESLLKNSYSPYSHFAVSCIAVTRNGKEYCGVNVENASYGCTICAERSAMLTAISYGCHKKDILELHILTSSGKIGTPCMACRQMIQELMDKDGNIFCYASDGTYQKYRIEELCPYPFTEEDLA